VNDSRSLFYLAGSDGVRMPDFKYARMSTISAEVFGVSGAVGIGEILENSRFFEYSILESQKMRLLGRKHQLKKIPTNAGCALSGCFLDDAQGFASFPKAAREIGDGDGHAAGCNGAGTQLDHAT
jgi:hypothetical protein